MINLHNHITYTILYIFWENVYIECTWCIFLKICECWLYTIVYVQPTQSYNIYNFLQLTFTNFQECTSFTFNVHIFQKNVQNCIYYMIVYVEHTQLCTFFWKMCTLNVHDCVHFEKLCTLFEKCVCWMYKITYIIWKFVYIKSTKLCTLFKKCVRWIYRILYNSLKIVCVLNAYNYVHYLKICAH